MNAMLKAAAIEHWCEICNKLAFNRHHLYPRSAQHVCGLTIFWRTETIWVCRKCHTEIHLFFRNGELAAKFNTAEALKVELPKRRALAIAPRPEPDPFSVRYRVWESNRSKQRKQREKKQVADR
jgi:hypothetical protein